MGKGQLLTLGIQCAERLGNTKLLDRLLEQALTNPPDDLSVHAMLLSEGATRRLQTGEPALAETMLWEAVGYFESLGDIRSRAVTMDRIADILQKRGDLDEALRICLEECLPVNERLSDVHSRAVTMAKIADIFQMRGNLDEALRICQEELVPVFERLGDIRSSAVTISRIADILQARGDLDEALRIRREEELPAFDRLGDVRERAVTMGRIADILQARGDLDEALRIRLQECLPVFDRLDDVRSRAVTMGQIADILEASNNLDEALRIRLEECLPVHQEMGDLLSMAYIRFRCADLRIRRGGFSTGEGQAIFEDLAESFRIFHELGHASFLVSVGSLFGQILAAAEEHEIALTVLDVAAAAAEKLQYWQQVTEIRELQEEIRGRAE